MKTKEEVEVKVGMKLYFINYFYKVCEAFVEKIKSGSYNGFVVIRSEEYGDPPMITLSSLDSFYYNRKNCLKDLEGELNNQIKILENQIEDLRKTKSNLFILVNNVGKELSQS